MARKCDNKEEDLTKHGGPLHVLGYKRGSDITEGVNREVKVYRLHH